MRIRPPAIMLYITLGTCLVLAEYAQTLDDWPGVFNPTIPQFEAHHVKSWNACRKYTATLFDREADLSVESSQFTAGPNESPWKTHDSLVLGVATFVRPSVKLFADYFRTDGYVPPKFTTGAMLAPA